MLQPHGGGRSVPIRPDWMSSYRKRTSEGRNTRQQDPGQCDVTRGKILSCFAANPIRPLTPSCRLSRYPFCQFSIVPYRPVSWFSFWSLRIFRRFFCTLAGFIRPDNRTTCAYYDIECTCARWNSIKCNSNELVGKHWVFLCGGKCSKTGNLAANR